MLYLEFNSVCDVIGLRLRLLLFKNDNRTFNWKLFLLRSALEKCTPGVVSANFPFNFGYLLKYIFWKLLFTSSLDYRNLKMQSPFERKVLKFTT